MTNLADFGLSSRTLNSLLIEGIDTLEKLECRTREELLLFPNIGRRALRELEEKGVRLKVLTPREEVIRKIFQLLKELEEMEDDPPPPQ